MKLLQRLRNLWMLSRFKITEFDNKLVITKDERGELIVARYNKTTQAQIIKREPDIFYQINGNN